MNNVEKANQLFNEANKFEKSLEIQLAISKYIEAGELGHEEAVCKAGHCCQFMKGDLKTAIELYKKAIDMGSANAKFLLGNCYYEGIGVDKNPEKGTILRMEALHEGSALAQDWFSKIIGMF